MLTFADNAQWESTNQAGASALPKSAWQPANRQAQASNAVSNWSRGGANQDVGLFYQPIRSTVLFFVY